ncbi:MAG: hypothetical protein ACYCZF_01825 [Anaerolineae bacterium]
MKKRGRGVIIVVIVLLFACSGMLLLELLLHPLRRTYDNVIMDNVNHYLPCSALPAEEKVLQMVDEHRAELTAIEQLAPSLIGVEVDTGTCPGKGDLVIWYASHAHRLQVEKMLNSRTFYGIPYRLQNR